MRVGKFLAKLRAGGVKRRGPIILPARGWVKDAPPVANDRAHPGRLALEEIWSDEPPAPEVRSERPRAHTMRVAAPVLVCLLVFALLGMSNGGRAFRVAASFMSPPVPVALSRAAADGLLARGDFAAAETAYRALLEGEPANPALHYSLGITLSHLDRLSDTAEQFQWVVEHGTAGREEVASARQWLNSLATGQEAAGERAPEETTALIESVSVGSLKGRTVWPGLTPSMPAPTLELKLLGAEPATAGKAVRAYVRLGAPYRVSRIPAGAYGVTARAEGRDLWKTRVVIAEDTVTVLDLTPETSLLTPEQFQPRESS